MRPRDAIQEARLLDDAAVREFLTNGFVRLTPDVDPGVHREVDALLRFACERETWHGNNILARVPRMYEVLDCPVVRGALISLAGPHYYLHPHRAVHTSTPVAGPSLAFDPAVDAPPMGQGSRAGSGWHQDAQSPLARARHHVPRYLIGFYFPHDTPLAMGPTRFQAGSHLHAHPVEPHGVVLDSVAAGTFLLLHFDMVHAGFPNATESTRYMVKFVFARTCHPTAPSWENAEAAWRRPERCIPDCELPATWSYLWNWMRGTTAGAAGAPSGKTDGVDPGGQAVRLERIYARAAHADVDGLADALAGRAGQGRHERVLARDEAGGVLPRDDIRGYPRRWNERAVVMEDGAHRLAACGPRAIPRLLGLLELDDPWVRINAAFALGEMGPVARDGVAAVTGLLDDPHQQVVRQALDALGAIGRGIDAALPKIEALLLTSNPAWQEAQVLRGWVAEDQVRINAAFVLLNAVSNPGAANLPAIEAIASAALGVANGYVDAVLVETLARIGTPGAHARAIRFLSERRWDETLMGDRKPF